jgi:hypothetical protein
MLVKSLIQPQQVSLNRPYPYLIFLVPPRRTVLPVQVVMA